MHATKTLPEDISGIIIPDKKLRILHLEDLPSDALLIEKALLKGKVIYERLVVDTRDKFIKALNDFSPDIILADHSLPSFNSLDALVLFHETKMEVPFILVTATISEEFAVDILKKGADDYILKDRLKRLPIAIYNSLEKFRLKKEQQIFLNEIIKNEKHYHALIENGNDGLVIFNLEGKPTYVSGSLKRILGYTEKEAMQLSIYKIIHPDDRETLSNKMTECLGKPGVRIEGHVCRVKHKNGTWRWLEATITNLLHDPEIKGIVVNFRDITEKITAEKIIRESEAKYRTFFENSMDGILLTEKNGKIIQANIAACAIFKMTEDEIIIAGRARLAVMDDPKLKVFLEERERNGKAIGKVTFKHKDGSHFPGEISSSVFVDVDGNEKRAMIIRDTSERTIAEGKLQQSEWSLKQAQSISHSGSWELDFATGLATWSEEALKIYGIPIANTQHTNETWLSFIHPGDIEQVMHDLKASEATLSDLSLHHRVVKKDGTIKHISSQTKFKLSKDGKPIGMYCAFQDVSKIMESQDNLKKSEANLQIIFNNTSEAFLLFDLNGTLKSFNNNAKEYVWLNSERELVVGKCIYEFIPASRLEEYKKTVANVLSGETINYDQQYEKKNGETTWYNFLITPVFEGDNIAGFCITASDITKRKQSEIDVTNSELKYRQIVETAQEGIWLIDENNITTFVNKKMCEILEYSEAEMLGKENHYFMDDAGKQDAAKTHGRRIEGNVENVDMGFITKSGKHIWINLSAKIIFDNEGNYKGALGMVTDITEKKKADEMLQRSEQRYREIAVNMQEESARLIEAQSVAKVGSWETDLQTFNAKWSEETNHIFETNPKYFQATHEAFLNFIHPDERNNVNTTFKNSLNTQTINSIEHRIISTNGKVKHVIENWKIYRDAKGNPVSAIGTCQDITERKIAEQELKNSNFRFEMISRATNDALWDWDFETGKLWANETHQRLYGLTLADPVPTEDLWKERIHPEDRDILVARQIRDFNSDKNIFISEYRFLNANKEYRNIYDRCYIVRNNEGNPVSMVGSMMDITEQKIAENKLIATSSELILALADLNKILDSSLDVICTVNNNGEFVNINAASQQVWGYTPEELIGTKFINLVYQDDVDRTLKAAEQIVSGIPVPTFENRYVHKNGKVVPILWSVNWDEEFQLMFCIAKDDTERKKADEQNSFKANLLNMIGQAAIATDLDGVVNYWNKAAEDIYGWTAEEAMGKNIMQLTPAHTTREQASEIMEDLKNGHRWSGEFRVQRKDGTDFPAWVTDSPIYDQNNKLSGIIGISSDITESKKAEEMLIESEAKLKTAQSIAQVGSWEVNLINNKHSWSDEFCRIFGVGCEEVIPSSEAFLSFVHPLDAALAISCIENAFATFTNSKFKFRFIKKNGEIRYAATEWKFEFDHNNKPIRLDGILRDITQQTKLENEALKAYEEKNIILESIGDAFFAVDKDSIVTYWNNKAEIVMNKNRDEVIGKNIWDVFNGLLDTVTYKYYQAAMKENKEQHYETFSEKLGKWLEVSAYPSNNGLTGYFKDITKRKLADIHLSALNLKLNKHVNDLATSNRELEDFAYVASHDLQEPLRMVTGFLGQIEKKYSNVIDDKGKQYIHFAADGAKRMRQIILDLLEFSRVGKVEEKEEEIDLTDVVREVIILCQKQIKESKAIIKFENLPSLVIYKTPLRQVFQNLISNALKYHKKDQPPTISISAEESSTYWQFAIKDNGIGIEEEYFNKIFIIFQRLHNKDEYTGTGIGLAVCKKIIENFGGKIWLESEENKGSTFYFTIPKLLN